MSNNKEKTLRIKSLKAGGLWGRDKSFDIEFHRDVNILIGPNASGKTTILKLLNYSLNGNFIGLREIPFKSIKTELIDFDGGSSEVVEVRRSNSELLFLTSDLEETVDLSIVEGEDRARHVKARLRDIHRELIHNLSKKASAVWLPVSRRLPVSKGRNQRYMERRVGRGRTVTESTMESVDIKLQELLDQLETYRLNLDQSLSSRYKEFEKKVLQSVLYSEEHDGPAFSIDPAISEEDKERLINAFQAANLLDDRVRKRIDTHFKVARQVTESIENNEEPDADLISILPLIERTRRITEYARELEEDRKRIFKPLRKYEDKVNSFLEDKKLYVSDQGKLVIETDKEKQRVTPLDLSSGEKQVIILLTQALLREDEPVIYFIDEPELSLHVTWQEKLISSISELGNDVQIIAATHSPDIIGPFRDKVINLR